MRAELLDRQKLLKELADKHKDRGAPARPPPPPSHSHTPRPRARQACCCVTGRCRCLTYAWPALRGWYRQTVSKTHCCL